MRFGVIHQAVSASGVLPFFFFDYYCLYTYIQAGSRIFVLAEQLTTRLHILMQWCDNRANRWDSFARE